MVNTGLEIVNKVASLLWLISLCVIFLWAVCQDALGNFPDLWTQCWPASLETPSVCTLGFRNLLAPLLSHLPSWLLDDLTQHQINTSVVFAASWINLPAAAFIKSLISWFWDVTLARTGKATPSRVTQTAAAICHRWFICLLPLLQSKQMSTISYKERRLRSDDARASRPQSLWAPADGKVLNY